MNSFVRLQLASIVGSLVDFSSTWLWVTVFDAWYVGATIVGNILGGTILFILCRNWVFKKFSGAIPFQAAKFVLVFAGSIILTTLGIYLLTHFLRLPYMVSKIICSVILGLSYNYILQAKYVFV